MLHTMTNEQLDKRIRALLVAAWRRARTGAKRRWRQQAISGLNHASWRAERVILSNLAAAR